MQCAASRMPKCVNRINTVCLKVCFYVPVAVQMGLKG